MNRKFLLTALFALLLFVLSFCIGCNTTNTEEVTVTFPASEGQGTGNCCNTTNTEEVTVYNLYELNDAISHASFNSDTTIFIGADIAIGAGDGIEHISSSITFQPKDKDVKIYWTAENIDTYSGMFSVESGGKLTIMGNQGYTLTLDGNKKACPNNLQPLVYVGGDFTLADGGKLVNNAAKFGGGVCVYEDGTFTMWGGSITGNSAELEGGGDVDVYRIRGG